MMPSNNIDELVKDNTLPKYQCLIKRLRNLQNIENRNAYYRNIVTCMYPDGNYFQESSITNGYIDTKLVELIKNKYN